MSAFSELLKNIPNDTGLAFVIIQHLSPEAKSSLSEILSSKTRLPVKEVRQDTVVDPDHVYVLPPNRNIVIKQNVLKLLPRGQTGPNLPIDIFFTSLAKYKKSNAIGIILSGGGSDGTLGMRAIWEAGGITFAEDETAEFHGMPESAIAAKVAAYILSPAAMAEKLVSIARNLPLQSSEDNPPVKNKALSATEEKGFHEILMLLLGSSAVDFTYYKPGTIMRRIMRRMHINNLESFHAYAGHLQKNPQELERLYQDILIKVTNFFRDQSVFDFLRLRIFPDLFKNIKDKPGSIRIWIPGCSTGEEVYSFAISLAEYMEENKQGVSVQIFGTDISEESLSTARRGKYAKSIEASVPAKILNKYFHAADEGGYEIRKDIRAMCVFAKHNMIADTPFSKMDIVSCRNVLIYLDSLLQKKAFPLFHYALNTRGFLVLGTAETAASFQDLFSKLDGGHKIYTKKSANSRPSMDFSGATPPLVKNNKAPARAEPIPMSLEKRADSIVLSRHAPAGVLVNDDLTILQFRGDVSPYLKPVPGRATLDLARMAHKGLLARILESLAKVRKNGTSVSSTYSGTKITIEIIPPGDRLSAEKHYLVLFETTDSGPAANVKKVKNRQGHKKVTDKQQAELDSTIDQLQVLLEERDATNEELRSAHEEVMSVNEEMQSTVEELETTKEELQSANEELMTLNTELQNRNADLTITEDEHKKMVPQFKMRGEELYRKNEFISILAHELRNPLAPIVHSVEIAKFHGIEDPKINRLMGMIEHQTNALNSIIESLLDAARAMGGKIQIRLESVDFGTILQHAIETARLPIQLGRHTLELHLLDQPVRMLLDPLRIEQIIVNLLNNAAKYTEPGGTISVTAAQENEAVILSIKDTGIGIAEEMLPHLFNLFTQVNQPFNQFKGGLGVGLMLAKTLAELHGGSLTGSSPGLGKGSEFTLRLPLKKGEYVPVPAVSDLKNLNLKKKRVMVVDDNVDLADTFGELLRILDQEVTVLYDGTSVIEAVRIEKPEVIFIDIAMPSISGYELVKTLKKEPVLENAKLIALSGFGEEYREKSRQAGFDDHLVKPICIAALENILVA